MGSIIFFLIIGAIAGWLAGLLMKGEGYGAIGNILLGIVGAIIGGYLFKLVGIRVGGFFGSLISATLGAVILLYGAKILKI